MPRDSRLRLLSGLLLFATMPLPGSAGPRSVLLLVQDDGGFALNPYGDQSINTPALAQLASCGTTFDAAYTSVSSCSPSRASMLSGLPTHENGQYGLAHAQEHFSAFAGIRSLPNVAGEAGVATGIVGKYHVWSGGSPTNDGTASFNFSWGLRQGGPGGCQAGASYSCPSVDYNTVARNISYMRARFSEFLGWADAKPFFFLVGFGDSHRCGAGAAGEFCERWGRGGIPDWVPEDYAPSNVSLPFWVQDTPTARADWAHMYTAVNRMDQGVALLLAELETAGRANDTLVIFVSDNGAPFAAGKTNFYEPGARVPLIISAPGARGGARTSLLASTLDILPTALAWLGLPEPSYTLNGAPVRPRGRSLLPLLGSSSGEATCSGVAQTPSASSHTASSRRTMTSPLPQARAPPPPLPTNSSTARGSFQHHEIQEYFPMRMLVVSDARPVGDNGGAPDTIDRAGAGASASSGASSAAATFQYKLIMNIAGPYLPYPIASDLWSAPAFQDLVNRTANGQPTHWYRNFSAYLSTPRPRYELYDLIADPTEAADLAGDAAYAGIFATLKADMRAWQEETNDDWLIKYVHE